MFLLSRFCLALGLIPASRISVVADACLVGGPQISPENVAVSNCLPKRRTKNDLKTEQKWLETWFLMIVLEWRNDELTFWPWTFLETLGNSVSFQQVEAPVAMWSPFGFNVDVWWKDQAATKAWNRTKWAKICWLSNGLQCSTSFCWGVALFSTHFEDPKCWNLKQLGKTKKQPHLRFSSSFQHFFTWHPIVPWKVAAWSLDASVADWLMIAWLRDVSNLEISREKSVWMTLDKS